MHRGETTPDPMADSIPALSPIDNIPYELLEKIMLLVVISRASDFTRISPSQSLVLCCICQRWRQVALATPRLWAEATFPIFSGRKEDILPITELFLERSAPLPIAVDFITSQERAVFPIMVSVVHRWRSLDIPEPRGMFDSASLATIAACSLENLETLRLAEGLFFHLDPIMDAFRRAPRLHDVSLEPWHRSPPPRFVLPWAQLTRLTITYMTPEYCLDTLIHCKNLVSARIVTCQWHVRMPYTRPPNARPSVLKFMENLDISMKIRSTDEHLGPFLERLEFPALKSLTLGLSLDVCSWDGVEPEWFVSWLAPTLISSLARSPKLDSLTLIDCVFAVDVYGILQHTPWLTRLHFVPSDTDVVDDDFFFDLQYDAAVPLAPKLETLELIDVGVNFAEESFVDLIESRWWSDNGLGGILPSPPDVARLKRVQLHNRRLPRKEFSELSREKMELYRSQGLDLVYELQGSTTTTTVM
ncbi:F-box domain-containing protein [Mycena sanguinolenta]|uniref:F-box domain-containing protein n=1 Tax=Mycena sanguinolenta TaxID=230812 RepID=A0A8H6XAR6_9AGAR|nr:F-box domain-containing protein [Mycena sanguinolenta]